MHKLQQVSGIFCLVINSIFCITFFFARESTCWKNNRDMPAVECRLMEENFNLAVLEQEFERIKSAIIQRSKYTHLWQGIPLKNALGASNADGLLVHVSIKNNRMEKCYPTPYLNELPYIRLLLEYIEKRFKTEVGLVRIFKLPSNNSLSDHKDGSVFNFHTGKIYRLHVPIITSPDVQFIINKKAFYLEPGKLYFTDVSLWHSVINTSNTIDRVHLIIDVHASATLKKFILQSKEPQHSPII